MRKLSSDEEILKHLRDRRPILDVRAPIEFAQGALPSSFNLPLLNDDERAQVGTTYKNAGPEAALQLGYTLVSGSLHAERLAAWTSFLDKNPDAVVMCFRGGQRSQLVQAELQRNGYDKPLIEGGFKRVRTLLINQVEKICETRSFRVLSGYTGTGKTEVMRAESSRPTGSLPFLDLEKTAKHRGSSFGTWTEAQPVPVTFENQLGLEANRLLTQTAGDEPIWIEDESRSIGKRVLPLKLFTVMSESKVWIMERPRAERAVRLTAEYLTENYGLADGVMPSDEVAAKVRQDISRAILNIERRLGGNETKNILGMIDDATKSFSDSGAFSDHWPWVERILETYYDPLYENHLGQIGERVIGRGPEESFRAFVLR